MKIVTFGEIMLRLTPTTAGKKIKTATTFDVNYAGSESNVASALSALGHDTRFVTKLPQNEIGEGAIRSLQSHGINTSEIIWGNGRMGTYFIELGSSIRPSQVVYDRAQSEFSLIGTNEFEWDRILQNTRWLFVSGITAALSDQCAHELIKVVSSARAAGVKVAFDMNYRRSLWKDRNLASNLFEKVLEHTTLVFGNAGSLNDVFDMDYSIGDSSDTIKAMESFACKFDQKQVAFTSRISHSASNNELAGFLFRNNTINQSNTYKVEITDRFGTGDAFAAGCIHGLISDWDSQKVIEFGTAAFALKHTIYGDQHTSNSQEISAIMEGNISGQVIR